MRVVAVHPDVIVITSRVWQTTCTVIRGGSRPQATAEAFVVDSPVYPDELEVLPNLLEQAGFSFCGLLVTHADWDHLLARTAFADAALGCAETTGQRLAADPGAPQRSLREFDDDHYVVRPRPLSLGAVQSLPVPGSCALGGLELELYPTVGHTGDGMAIWAPWAAVLVVGDYLSPVEIPSFGAGGSPGEYAATLRRLRTLVQQAEHVVPGHGTVLDSDGALAVLEADLSYVEQLRSGGETAPLPRARRSAAQRQVHQLNVSRAREATA